MTAVFLKIVRIAFFVGCVALAVVAFRRVQRKAPNRSRALLLGIGAVAGCAVLAVCFLTDPPSEETGGSGTASGQTSDLSQRGGGSV